MMARGTRFLPVALVLAAGALAIPAFAQMSGRTAPPPGPPGVNGGAALSPTYSDATMTRAGHALRDVLSINQTYRQKLAATSDPDGKKQIVNEAKQQATAAVTRDGLSVDQYNGILADAQKDPTVRARLLSAAGIQDNGK